MINLLISIPFIFLISLGCSITLFLIGKFISSNPAKGENKLAPYACGEELPPNKIQINVRNFFLYVVYFMIFDISAFMLAMSYNVSGPYTIFFTLIILSALAWLLTTWRKK